MIKTKYDNGDIVRNVETNTEHMILSHCITTRFIDDDINKSEYTVEELYALTDVDELVDVSLIEFVRQSESEIPK
ncbi:MAG: hypothetical protein FWE14_04870 [Lachnospiraceae bacterium]|nr:hypothetical protein [Lachnospiraceae bacterium]